MLTADQIDALGQKAQQITDPIAEFLIRDIVRRISEAGQLTSTAAYQVWKLQNLGVSQKQLEKEIQKRLNISLDKVEQLLTQSAEVGYRFDLDRLPHAEAIPFKDNSAIQDIVSASVQMARQDLTNMVQTMGFVGRDGKALLLTQAYEQACDFAFQKVSTGALDYNSAIRQATKELAGRGIVTIDYASGKTRTLEAAVRGNVMGAMGTMQEKISQQCHDDFGCDGWEISAHANSAPDHEPIQGRQYTDEEYTRLNNSLLRRIGTLNCGHVAYPIIIGINSPQYTKEELEKFRQENEKGFTYGGKHYTGYEATQRQRKLERAIRDRKRRILIDEAAGDQERLAIDQTKLVRLNDEYARFNKAAKLRSQRERVAVAGFGRQQAAEARAGSAQKQLEKQRMEAYNKKKEEIQKLIKSDEIPKTLNRGNQQKHIKDSPGYIQGRSYIYGDLNTAQGLVNIYHGTGEPVFNRKGEWSKKEVVSSDRIIGINVVPDTGEETETQRFVIHYGKKGTHVVPTKELKK